MGFVCYWNANLRFDTQRFFKEGAAFVAGHAVASAVQVDLERMKICEFGERRLKRLFFRHQRADDHLKLVSFSERYDLSARRFGVRRPEFDAVVPGSRDAFNLLRHRAGHSPQRPEHE